MGSFRDKFKKSRKDLKKRHESSASRKVTYPTIIKTEALPDGMQTWWVKEGTHYFDIIPFGTGPNHPTDEVSEDNPMSFNVEYWVHRNVGPGEEVAVVNRLFASS